MKKYDRKTLENTVYNAFIYGDEKQGVEGDCYFVDTYVKGDRSKAKAIVEYFDDDVYGEVKMYQKAGAFNYKVELYQHDKKPIDVKYVRSVVECINQFEYWYDFLVQKRKADYAASYSSFLFDTVKSINKAYQVGIGV